MLHPWCQLERVQGVEGTPERVRIQFCFERKVIELGGIFEPFKYSGPKKLALAQLA